MVILAKSFGVLITILGLVFLIYPDWMKKVLAFWKEGKRIYGGGVIRLTVGVILIISAPQAAQPFTAAVLGMLIVLSGAVLYVMSLDEVKKEITFWQSQPVLVLRVMAVFIVLLGVLIISL